MKTKVKIKGASFDLGRDGGFDPEEESGLWSRGRWLPIQTKKGILQSNEGWLSFDPRVDSAFWFESAR